jgi:hypothetical protein
MSKRIGQRSLGVVIPNFVQLDIVQEDEIMKDECPEFDFDYFKVFSLPLVRTGD